MNNVTIKIHNISKQTAEIVAHTNGHPPVIIQAQPNVNYELINQETNKGPSTIVTKRTGNDLVVSLKEGTQPQDIVIKDYYLYEDQTLIGADSQGNYYNYAPTTGEAQDSTTNLLANQIESQTLSNAQSSSPLSTIGSTSPLLAAGLLGGAVVAAAAGGGGSGGGQSSTSNAQPSVSIMHKKNDGQNLEVSEADNEVTYVATLSKVRDQDTTVTLTFKSDSNAKYGTYGADGADITTKEGQTLEIMIPAGKSKQSLTLIVNDDDIVEGNEGYTLEITNVSEGAVISNTNHTVTTTLTDNGESVVEGNDKPNTLTGTYGNNKIYGLGGNDKLNGGAGDDKLYGGADDDELNGGAGNDELNGGAGDDILIFDTNDIIDGGEGFDTLLFTNNPSVITLDTNNISNIEKINLTDTNSQTLQLKKDDILDITENQTLWIDGDDQDRIKLDDNFTKIADNSDKYDKYTTDGATVFVANDVIFEMVNLS